MNSKLLRSLVIVLQVLSVSYPIAAIATDESQCPQGQGGCGNGGTEGGGNGGAGDNGSRGNGSAEVNSDLTSNKTSRDKGQHHHNKPELHLSF